MIAFNRVWVIGRDSYIRAYPNPGVGLKICSRYRVALSVRGGVEVFRLYNFPTANVWFRVWSFASRINRPGAVK